MKQKELLTLPFEAGNMLVFTFIASTIQDDHLIMSSLLNLMFSLRVM